MNGEQQDKSKGKESWERDVTNRQLNTQICNTWGGKAKQEKKKKKKEKEKAIPMLWQWQLEKRSTENN